MNARDGYAVLSACLPRQAPLAWTSFSPHGFECLKKRPPVVALILQQEVAFLFSATKETHHLFMAFKTVLQAEITHGVLAADSLDDALERALVWRILAVLHEPSDVITKYTAEIFVTGIGKEGS